MENIHFHSTESGDAEPVAEASARSLIAGDRMRV